MALSRLAREFAAEIKQHDWSDAPYRADRAGHNRSTDSNAGPAVLSAGETANVRINVMWVVGQVLGHADPNFNREEFAAACGASLPSGWLENGFRRDGYRYQRPGTYEWGDDPTK